MARKTRKATQKAKPPAVVVPVVPDYVFGRPTKLTPEVYRILVESAEMGLLKNGCANRAGITVQTLDNWLARGESAAQQAEVGTEPDAADRYYMDFFGAFQKARGNRQFLSLAKVHVGSRGWQGSAWFMERTDPLNYGRRFVKMEVTGKDGKPIESSVTVTDAGLTDGERARRMKALLALAAEEA